jgi:hypothetical protein
VTDSGARQERTAMMEKITMDDAKRYREALEAIMEEVLQYVQPGEEQDTVKHLPKAVARIAYENHCLRRKLARIRGEREPIDPRKIEQRSTRWNQLEIDDD